MNLDKAFDVSMTRRRKLQDMAKIKVECLEDYLKYMDRMPEIKMSPEKVDLEELTRSASDFSFVPTKKERFDLEAGRLPPVLGNPVPISMQGVRMEDLAAVDIHWKMLTDLRPLNRLEDDIFNKLVDMGKFRKTTKESEAKALATMISQMPGSSGQAKVIALGFISYKSKRGTMETKVKTCRECGLELCTGAWCRLGHYDYYNRVILDNDELEAEEKGFSLKSVIAQANAKPDAKAAEAKVRERRAAKKGPSLKAMISAVRPKRKKRKKKRTSEDE